MTYTDDDDKVEVVASGSSMSHEDDSGVDGKESSMVSSGVGPWDMVQGGNESYR